MLEQDIRQAVNAIIPSPAADGWRPMPPDAFRYNPEWTPVRRRLLGQRLTITDSMPDDDVIVAALKDHYWEGDRLMDDVATMFRRLPVRSGRQLFEQALENGIGSLANPPDELAALHRQLDRVPEWIDLKQVDRGAIVAANISKAGKAAGILLNTIQTFQGGQIGDAVGTTGRLLRGPLLRARESASFWVALPKPGGLGRFGEGFKTAVRVRLIHSQVRNMLMEKWGLEWVSRNGIPIPNSSIAAGIPTFGIVNVLYDSCFGRKHSRQDLEDIHAYWAYIGYILGADEDLLPRTPEDGMKILNFALSTMPSPSPYANELNRISDVLFEAAMSSIRFPLIDAKVKKYLHEALNGFYFYVGGSKLGNRITGACGPTLVGRAFPFLLKCYVHVSNIRTLIPGADVRRNHNRKNGDPFWAAVLEQLRTLTGQQTGPGELRYDAHDALVPNEIIPPLPQR